MRTKIQPLFKWTGSKQRMLDSYTHYFFPSTAPARFVDLFAGALTMTLWVHEKYPECELVVNDANVELIDLYRELAQRPDDIISEWQRHVSMWVSFTDKQEVTARSGKKMSMYVQERRHYYNTLLNSYANDYFTLNPTVRAGMLLFMLQTNFNGMWKNYHKYHNRYSTPPGSCQQGAAFFDESNIRRVASVLQRATILCGSYADAPLQPGDFVYADPPYRDSSVNYDVTFGEQEQVALARHLMSHDGPFAYSNKKINTTDNFYSTHFPNMPLVELGGTYTAGASSEKLKVTEVLITREPHKPIINSLLPLF